MHESIPRRVGAMQILQQSLPSDAVNQLKQIKLNKNESGN